MIFGRWATSPKKKPVLSKPPYQWGPVSCIRENSQEYKKTLMLFCPISHDVAVRPQNLSKRDVADWVAIHRRVTNLDFLIARRNVERRWFDQKYGFQEVA